MKPVGEVTLANLGGQEPQAIQKWKIPSRVRFPDLCCCHSWFISSACHCIEGVVWMGWVTYIEKEEQGEWMEKIFQTTQGNFSSCGAWRHGMMRLSMDLNLEGDKWKVGWGAMSRGGPVGERRAMTGAAPLPFFCCTAREKWEMSILIGYGRESRSKEVESKWLKGGSLT